VVRKQSLQQLRLWLHQHLSSWIQRLAPAPLEAAPSLGADATATAAATAATAASTSQAVAAAKALGALAPEESVEIREAVKTDPAIPMPLPSVIPTGGTLRFVADRAALCPGLREPLSVEQAVLARDMTLLKREAADALAALGAAHALVTSARLAQVQHLRPLVEKGEVPAEALKALAADYQGWQNDQVRLFDALALVMRMQVPQGLVLEQVDPALQDQAKQHLASLAVEYQRRQLQHQIKRQS